MVTSAGVFYPTGKVAGFDLAGFRTSAQGPQFPIKMQIKLTGGKRAIYVLASTAVIPSASVDAIIGTDGTITVSDGPFVSMNSATAEAGSYLWIRSSADVTVP